MNEKEILKILQEAQDLQDIEDNGDEDWLEAYIEATGCDLNIAVDKYDTSTFYHDMSLVDVAYDIVEECYNLPENLERYFDYEAFARDLEIEGYTETYYGTILV